MSHPRNIIAASSEIDCRGSHPIPERTSSNWRSGINWWSILFSSVCVAYIFVCTNVLLSFQSNQTTMYSIDFRHSCAPTLCVLDAQSLSMCVRLCVGNICVLLAQCGAHRLMVFCSRSRSLATKCSHNVHSTEFDGNTHRAVLFAWNWF